MGGPVAAQAGPFSPCLVCGAGLGLLLLVAGAGLPVVSVVLSDGTALVGPSCAFAPAAGWRFGRAKQPLLPLCFFVCMLIRVLPWARALTGRLALLTRLLLSYKNRRA